MNKTIKTKIKKIKTKLKKRNKHKIIKEEMNK